MTQKSTVLTFILSFLVSGVGHLYLGLNKRGLQFMVAFFACIVLIPSIPMVFPFVLAIVWFYALFDALQLATELNLLVAKGQATHALQPDSPKEPTLSELDRAMVSTEALQGASFSPVWMGVVSIVIGIVVLIRILLPHVWTFLVGVHVGSILLAVALIGFGIWLIRAPLGRD